MLYSVQVIDHDVCRVGVIMNKGFTLIELLIVIAMMSMTLAIGLPSFQSIIASTRLTSTTNAMVSALQLARSEAMKQHKNVFIAKKTNWKDGWIVYVDTNLANPIASFDALNSTMTITPSQRYIDDGRVRYSPNGSALNGTFTFCLGTDARKITIAATGRIRVETPTTCN
jgi:type IV fimbrial biogenesis protein FimT